MFYYMMILIFLIFFSLKSVLSDINRTVPASCDMVFIWYDFFFKTANLVNLHLLLLIILYHLNLCCLSHFSVLPCLTFLLPFG